MRTSRGGVIGCFISEYCFFHLFKPVIIEVVTENPLTAVHDYRLCVFTTFSSTELVLDDNFLRDS